MASTRLVKSNPAALVAPPGKPKPPVPLNPDPFGLTPRSYMARLLPSCSTSYASPISLNFSAASAESATSGWYCMASFR